MAADNAIPSTRTIVGIDDSEASRAAIEWAAADVRGRGTTLTLVHGESDSRGVLSAVLGVLDGWPPGTRARARATMSRALDIARSATEDTVAIDTVSSTESAVHVLTEYAEDARLLVLGSRDRGRLTRTVLGSVSSVVASRVSCPVAIVPQNDAATGRSQTSAAVVVGLDHSPNDDAVLAVAFEQAARRGVALCAVHAYEPSDAAAAKRWIDRLVGSWSVRFPAVEVHTDVVQDYPSHALLDNATRAQLLVVGARGRGTVSPLLIGSTSRALLHRALVPVIIVPAKPSDQDLGSAVATSARSYSTNGLRPIP